MDRLCGIAVHCINLNYVLGPSFSMFVLRCLVLQNHVSMLMHEDFFIFSLTFFLISYDKNIMITLTKSEFGLKSNGYLFLKIVSVETPN